jgi:hypothetical protein
MIPRRVHANSYFCLKLESGRCFAVMILSSVLRRGRGGGGEVGGEGRGLLSEKNIRRLWSKDYSQTGQTSYKPIQDKITLGNCLEPVGIPVCVTRAIYWFLRIYSPTNWNEYIVYWEVLMAIDHFYLDFCTYIHLSQLYRKIKRHHSSMSTSYIESIL